MVIHQEVKTKSEKALRGYLDLPSEFNGDLVIMFHGFTGNKTEHARHFLNFSRLLSKEKIASLRLDFSGNGESDGEFSDFTIDTMIDEAKQIVEYGRKIKGVKRIILLGFSMGGAVATYLSSLYKNEIAKILLWSPAANISDIIKNSFEKAEKLPNGNAIHGTFELSQKLYESALTFNPLENIELYTNPVMIIHGKKDKSVDYMYSIRYSVLYSNSRVHLINTAGHGYDAFSERDELYQKSLEFLKH